MKRSFISFIVLALAISVCAQAPLSFKYQAYLRNADGTIRGNEFVTLQLKIVQGTINGATVYSEVHNTSTNGHGLVSVSVGDGSTSFNMSAIQWEFGPFFLDITVNGIHLGTTELLSVPFALYANETGSSFSGEYSDLNGTPNLATVATTGNYLHLTNRPSLALVATTGSYTSLLNVPSTFNPTAHTHLEDQITDLAHYTDDSISGTEAAFVGWDMDVSDDFSGSYIDLTDIPPATAHYTDDSIDGTEAAFVGWDMDVSDDFVGDMGGAVITNLADPINPQDAATRAYVDASSGGFSGSFNDLIDVPVNLDIDATDDFVGDMGGAVITNLGAPIAPTDAATRGYVDGLPGGFSGSFNDLTNVPVNLDVDATDDFDGNYSSLTGAPAQIGDLGGNMGTARITNLGTPLVGTDAATMAYVDLLETTVANLQAQVDALDAALVALEARVTVLDGGPPPPPQ